MASIARHSTRNILPAILRSRPYVLQPPKLQQHGRSVTNATRPDFIPNLRSVPRVPARPGNWHPTLVHSSGEVKFTVIRLAAGQGEVPRHFHNEIWDYFMPLQGRGVIETKTKDGVEREYEMLPGSFLAVGRGDVHRVRNAGGEGEEFVFFIAQAPRGRYDFVGVED